MSSSTGLHRNVGGNVYDKYHSTHPIARRLMQGFFAAFDALISRAAPATAFEIGCGEGELAARLLRRGIDTRGSDVEAPVVAAANALARRLGCSERFTTRSVYDLAPGEITADVIVCCEDLEHLDAPERALEVIAAQRGAHLLFSAPREPIWRAMNVARGKYLKALGNTPGHVQHWGRAAFLRLIAQRFEITEVRSPLPWTMVLARPRPAPPR